VLKNVLFALLTLALCAPTAEAAKPHRAAKAVNAKPLRIAKVVKKPLRPSKAVVHRVRATRVAAVEMADIGSHFDVKSSAALVIEPGEGRTLYAKNIDAVQPIASITKLMTAMVVLDANLDLREPITITEDDVDLLKHTRSRLRVGTVLERDELLRLALMASENRAAAALGRSYPGGIAAFVVAMNQKAFDLGMTRTRFVDSSGLSSDNVSTAQDLAKMVTAAYRYPLIQEFTTTAGHAVRTHDGRVLSFRNTNGLVRDDAWHIDVSKTGYIAEAGKCLVMQARIAAKPIVIVLLDSWGKYTRIGDANRIKKWIESPLARAVPG
jgi:serine-type D-Ala-D-Ala endopeptidase (penicillin-binding protein 7)